MLCEESGETVLGAGDCAGFKAGVANGHCIQNRGDSPAVLFEIGSRDLEETAHYPGIDLVYDRRDGQRRFLHLDGTPYEED